MAAWSSKGTRILSFGGGWPGRVARAFASMACGRFKALHLEILKGMSWVEILFDLRITCRPMDEESPALDRPVAPAPSPVSFDSCGQLSGLSLPGTPCCFPTNLCGFHTCSHRAEVPASRRKDPPAKAFRRATPSVLRVATWSLGMGL